MWVGGCGRLGGHSTLCLRKVFFTDSVIYKALIHQAHKSTLYISLKLLREPINISAILRLMHFCFNQRQQLILRLCQTTIFVKLTIILIWTGTDASLAFWMGSRTAPFFNLER